LRGAPRRPMRMPGDPGQPHQVLPPGRPRWRSTDVTHPDPQPGHLARRLRNPRAPVHRGALRPCRPSPARLDVRHPVLGAARAPPVAQRTRADQRGSTTRSRSVTASASAPRSWAPTSSAPRAGRTIRTGRAGGGRHGVQRGRGVLGLGLLLRPLHRNRGAAPGLHPARRLDLASHDLTVDDRARRTPPTADPDGTVGTWLRSEPPV
jgi:hypothetical protein